MLTEVKKYYKKDSSNLLDATKYMFDQPNLFFNWSKKTHKKSNYNNVNDIKQSKLSNQNNIPMTIDNESSTSDIISTELFHEDEFNLALYSKIFSPQQPQQQPQTVQQNSKTLPVNVTHHPYTDQSAMDLIDDIYILVYLYVYLSYFLLFFS